MSANRETEHAGAGACVACRGAGRLISSLGGSPHPVTCPWCRGSGQRIPGVDAQQSPAETLPPPKNADRGGGPQARTQAQANR